MVDVVVLCEGCKGEIHEGNEDIVIVEIGKAEFDGCSMVLGDVEDLWYGHKQCFKKHWTD